MVQTVISDLKKGDLFFLKNTPDSTVYVRDHYDRSSKSYAYHKYYDYNSEYFASKKRIVYINS